MRINIPPAMNIGQAIRDARKAANLTQPELAEKCGWGYRQARISHYENGRNTPGVEELETIASALGLTLSQFFEGHPATKLEIKTSQPVDSHGLAARLVNLPPDRQRLIVELIEALQPQ